jgi:hypothetical protein
VNTRWLPVSRLKHKPFHFPATSPESERNDSGDIDHAPFWSKDSAFRIAILLILVLSAALVVRSRSDSSWTDDNIDASKASGTMIIQALGHYKTKHRSYPAALSDLVSEELPKIEPPTAGEGKWHYFVSEKGDSFTLSFSSREKHHSTYQWTTDWNTWGYTPGDS